MQKSALVTTMTRTTRIRLTIAATIALAAVAMGGYFLLRPDERPHADAVRVADSRSNGRERRSTREPPEIAGRPSQPLAVERTAALEPEWNDGTHDVVGPMVEGTVVVIDRQHEKHDRENGSFVPIFIDGVDADRPESDRFPRVAVTNGRFRFDSRGATAMLVEELELGGRTATVGRAAELAPDSSLALEANWSDDVILHVVDATSRAELEDVEVASAIHSDPACEHPGVPSRADVIADHKCSPLHLTRSSATDRARLSGQIWVSAAGHAWSRETIDFERDQMRTVELEPAGALRVTIKEAQGTTVPPSSEQSDASQAGPRLRLRRSAGASAGTMIADVAATPGVIESSRIAPGEITVSVEEGDPFPTPEIRSSAAVVVSAGATASVTVSLDPSDSPGSQALTGTLFIPEGWGTTEMEITITPLTLRGGTLADRRWRRSIESEPVPGRPGWSKWGIEPVIPAGYVLSVDRARFEARVDVGGGGRANVVLRLPEPALLRVHVVDVDTQTEISDDRVNWHPRGGRSRFDPDEPGSSDLREEKTTLEWDPEADCYVGAVPPGRGQLTVDLDVFAISGKLESDRVWNVHAGDNEMVVKSHVKCGVDLTVVRTDPSIGSVLVDWTRIDPAQPKVYGVEILLSGPDRPLSRIVLPAPGRYRFTRFAGRDCPPDVLFVVDVPPGEFVEETITIDH